MLNSHSKEPFKVDRPALRHVPFVFNSPHSGRFYAPEFLASTRLNHLAIRKSEDFLVDELFACAVPLGATMLSANFPRAWLDVNREPYELDPSMFLGPLPAFANINSARVTGGLGTIARVVSETEEIYRDKIPIADALLRIETLYKPYHAALRNLLAQCVVRFGHAILIDCHSMPSAGENTGRRTRNGARADFVIGDRHGASCAPEITHAVHEFLTDLGYNVALNKPYAGGFITEHYGRPENGLHSIQIEINRALYMDEINMKRSANFNQLASDLSVFTSRLVSLPKHTLKGSVPLAAE